MSPSTSARDALARELRASIRGDVLVDELSLGIYATDASNYQILPLAIVVPCDEDDVRTAVAIAVRHRVPILPRGGGTSLAGQTVGAAMVVDFSKHMNGLIQLDLERRRVRVQPGLVRDELNARLREHGLHFAPDPATSSRANIGGMIGNNSSGARSILFGKTIDHVIELRVLLADGCEVRLAESVAAAGDKAAPSADRAAEIQAGLRRIVESHRDAIASRFPKVMRRVGGYPLDELLDDERWNPAKIMVGSEGTLGLVLEATLNLEPLPPSTSLCVLHFDELLEAIGAVEHILPHRPAAVEILDRTVLDLAHENREQSKRLAFLHGEPAAVLIVEFYGESDEEVGRRASAMAAEIRERGLGYAHPVITDSAGQVAVWEVRKSGLGIMLGMKGSRKPLPFIEDAAIPTEVLPEYIARVMEICADLDTEAAMYAHASVGVIHVRPVLDLQRADDIERMKEIAERTFALVQEYGGAWSGEHGDGLVRSPFNERFFGEEVYGALRQVKALFDPEGLMNPGKIVDAPPIDENLRFGTGYGLSVPDTVFQYRDDGSFAGAVEMCTGVGHCRKTLAGTMCPSYMATRDEEHSTRGRANALRLAMSGQLGADGLTGEGLRRALDLCLSCKGCKTECPSNVDMAKLKSEVLQLVYDRHGTTLRDRLIGASAKTARRLAGFPAPWINRIQGSVAFRRSLEGVAGLDHRRKLPSYAGQRFTRWAAGRAAPTTDRRVALFADTYLECHDPHVGRSAVELLESCGYEVIVADAGCCQRPRISHGLLRDARRDGERTLRALDELVADGVPILVCEPSCASALTDDLPDLVEDRRLGQRVADATSMIDVFLDAQIESGRLECDFVACAEATGSEILLHGHCHQKALFGTEAMKRLLGRIPDLRVREVDSGCCGMAGSFGYEREHYELSREIGEDRLFPAVRALDEQASIVACGFSCRHQLEHFTGRTARHWVETIRARRPGIGRT